MMPKINRKIKEKDKRRWGIKCKYEKIM